MPPMRMSDGPVMTFILLTHTYHYLIIGPNGVRGLRCESPSSITSEFSEIKHNDKSLIASQPAVFHVLRVLARLSMLILP